MNADVVNVVERVYRRNETAVLFDANPAAIFAKLLNDLKRTYKQRFDKLASRVASTFVDNVIAHTNRFFKKNSIPLVKLDTRSRALRTIIKATVHENVQLIKSIPVEYLKDVETDVFQSITTGRDLSTLSKDLQAKYGVARRRAELISRDQNDKATQSIALARQRDAGITEAIWRHSGAGKHPRKAHVAADGKRFDITKGLLIDGRYIFPGQDINCRCTSQAIIDDDDDEE